MSNIDEKDDKSSFEDLEEITNENFDELFRRRILCYQMGMMMMRRRRKWK